LNRTQVRRRERHATAQRTVVDGLPLARGPVARLRRRLQSALVSAAEREEAVVDRHLLERPAPTCPNTIAVASPKSGVGKTTASFLAGNLLASRLGLRVVAVDANPDLGTLGELARRGCRANGSLADLLRQGDRPRTASELRRFAVSLPTGLHVLAGDRLPTGLTAARCEELVDLLERFYDVVILDLGTAAAGGLTRFVLDHSDQLVLVSDAQWVAARTLLDALPHLAHERTVLVLNKARPQRDAGQASIERHLDERAPDGAHSIPYDATLAAMLDSGTYTLEALARPTRVAVKRLGLAVAEQLV
jgi:MinD-like ATPase involved in chromosome partitioning or flagellar assembly